MVIIIVLDVFSVFRFRILLGCWEWAPIFNCVFFYVFHSELDDGMFWKEKMRTIQHFKKKKKMLENIANKYNG